MKPNKKGLKPGTPVKAFYNEIIPNNRLKQVLEPKKELRLVCLKVPFFVYMLY